MYIFLFAICFSALIIFSKLPKIKKLLNVFTDDSVATLKTNLSQQLLSNDETQNYLAEKNRLRKKYLSALNINKKKYSKAKEILFLCIKEKNNLRASIAKKTARRSKIKFKDLKELEKSILQKQIKIKRSLIHMKKKDQIISENLHLLNQELFNRQASNS